MLVDVGDTRLHVTSAARASSPLIVLHGGPGLDHTMFGSYLDALGDRCRLLLVDERGTGRSEPAPPETWALAHHAADVEALAGALGLERYVVLGHSFGAFIALQHAVDFPGSPAATVVSSGVAHARFLAHVEEQLAAFEPVELREQVQSSWAREARGAHAGGRRRAALRPAALPLRRPARPAHRRDARRHDRRGLRTRRPARRRDRGLRRDRASRTASRDVTHPVLVLAGRHDRTCPVAAAEAMAAGLPDAELVVFEHSGHMAFVEENAAYLAAVRDFLDRRMPGLSDQPRRADLGGGGLGRVELVAHELEALRPEAGVLEVEPGDRGQLLGAARAAGAQQLEVARDEVLALLEVAAGRPTAPAAGRRRRRRRSRACR